MPPGIAHGYKVIGTDPAMLVYLTDRFYDPKDEGRIPYDHPQIHTIGIRSISNCLAPRDQDQKVVSGYVADNYTCAALEKIVQKRQFERNRRKRGTFRGRQENRKDRPEDQAKRHNRLAGARRKLHQICF